MRPPSAAQSRAGAVAPAPRGFPVVACPDSIARDTRCLLLTHTSITATRAGRGQLALEVLDAAGELVALGAQRIELLLARQPSLLLLSERRLQRRLSGIDVLHLGLETRHPLLGGKPTGKERVGEEPGQQDRGDDDEPGSPSTRLGDHGP